MKYASGQELKIGDRVRLGDDSSGIVVYIIDTGEGSDDHPAGSWDYLKQGSMIRFEKYGLIHYIEPDQEPDLSLISRGPGNDEH